MVDVVVCFLLSPIAHPDPAHRCTFGANEHGNKTAVICTCGMILPSFIGFTISHYIYIRIPMSQAVFHGMPWGFRTFLKWLGRNWRTAPLQCRNYVCLIANQTRTVPFLSLKTRLDFWGRNHRQGVIEWFNNHDLWKISIRLKSLVKLYEPQSKSRQMILDISFIYSYYDISAIWNLFYQKKE